MEKDDCNMVGQQGMIMKVDSMNGYDQILEVGCLMQVATVKQLFWGGGGNP